jgi:hypothetical protein
MSHNIISVDTDKPDVNTRLYSGIEYIQFGRGETPASPSLTVSVGNNWPFYDTAPINKISGATISTSSDVLTSITLPAGKYVCYVSLGATSITSGYNFALYHIVNSSNALCGHESTVGVPFGQTNTIAVTYQPNWINITSSTTINIECRNYNASSGSSVSTTNARYAETSSVCILKVG